MGRITVLESSLSALNLRTRSWLTYDPATAQNVTCLRMSLSSASDMGREWSDHQAQNTVELPRLVKEFMPNLVELVLHYTYYDVSEDPNNGKGLPLHDFGESILRWILTRLSSAPNLRVLTLTNAFGLDGLDPHKDLLVGFDDFPPALEYIAAWGGNFLGAGVGRTYHRFLPLPMATDPTQAERAGDNNSSQQQKQQGPKRGRLQHVPPLWRTQITHDGVWGFHLEEHEREHVLDHLSGPTPALRLS
ncbi:hypothetical protein OC834_003580 [Tilletia horrida]|nr:hypothetical protein OC834_003580 [Tilletia horrida]